MGYGFIVVAYLVMAGGDSKLAVPFASLEACETARTVLIDKASWSRKRLAERQTCVETGA